MADASIPFQQVIVGEIHPVQPLSEVQYNSISSGLAAIGRELIYYRTGGLIEKIKQLVIKKARNEVDEKEQRMNLSAYLSQILYHEYTDLSSLFSSFEGRTIENYFIQQRIEKAKELLVYNEMTLSAIAFEMDYSSAAHHFNQFKQITGLTRSPFSKVGSEKRKLPDQL